MEKIYDCLIIGGGVAGMSASIYAKRRGKDVAIIEKYVLGGTVNTIPKIANFPSQSLIDGMTLSQMFAQQIKSLDVPVIADDVLSVDFSSDVKTLVGKKKTYFAKTVVIATGLSYIELGKNEEEYVGRGVSYCAVCDANFFKNQTVCVASRFGSGMMGAKTLSEVCEKVIVLDSEDMTALEKANHNNKISIVSNAQILKVDGKDAVDSVQVAVNGKKQTIQTSALFIELGRKPKTQIYTTIAKDEKGFILTDENMKTSVDGVYAVGDVRSKNLRQIVTACSDGAIAGQIV